MTVATWSARVWAEFRAENLTRAYRDVLLTLRTFRGPGGIAWPSHETLAERAGCSVRTVQRALAQARLLGLTEWTERRVRAGWRWLRTSNVYTFRQPDAPAAPGMRAPFPPRRATTGQNDRGGESLSKKEALREMMREAAKLPDLLAAAQARFAARFAR
jgi:DNA-binding transcriptional MocR family regulator